WFNVRVRFHDHGCVSGNAIARAHSLRSLKKPFEKERSGSELRSSLARSTAPSQPIQKNSASQSQSWLDEIAPVFWAHLKHVAVRCCQSTNTSKSCRRKDCGSAPISWPRLPTRQPRV